MKIAFVTGSYPPMRCGVGDYTYRLIQTLTELGHTIDVFTRVEANEIKNANLQVFPVVRRWTLRCAFSLYCFIRRVAPDIVHIQYPTAGYYFNLGPHVLAFLFRISGMPVITTIHEFRYNHFLRRCSIIVFLLMSSKVIFTTSEEKNYVAKRFPFCKRKFIVINLGSNIQKIEDKVKANLNIISYFGLFHHTKSIEKIIDAFKILLDVNPDFRLRLIGDISPRDIHYFEEIKQYAKNHIGEEKIEWFVGKNFEEISGALKESCVCILLYPDGVSFRRTSFLATLELGIPCVTTKGESTPSELLDDENVLFASAPIEIAKKIQYLRDNIRIRERIVKNILTLSKRFSWEMIGKRHVELYQEVVESDEHRTNSNDNG